MSKNRFYLHKYLGAYVPGPKFSFSFFTDHKIIWFKISKAGTRSAWATFDRLPGFIYNGRKSIFPRWAYKNWTTFTIVRNPVSRCVSAYSDKILNDNWLNFSWPQYEKLCNTDHFLDWLERQDLRTCDVHFRYQSSMFPPFVDHIFKLEENIEGELERLLEIPGFKLKHLHSTPSKREFTAEQLERVRRIYARDIETLGY